MIANIFALPLETAATRKGAIIYPLAAIKYGKTRTVTVFSIVCNYFMLGETFAVKNFGL